MDRPVIFLSAVSAEFRELRQLLHDSFKTHFHVITQDDTLHQFPGGDVRQLLSDAIDGSHAVLHLAGAGFGSTAAAPFPEMPGFLCSWTQYEYYYAHSFDADHARRKQIFAIVCGPTLRSPTFTEKDDATLTAAQKSPLQEAHCQRIFSGKFDATPLASLPRTVNHGQPINDNAAALRAAIDICAQLATRQPAFQSACALVQVSLQDQLQPLLDAQARLEANQEKSHRLSRRSLYIILSTKGFLAIITLLGIWWLGNKDHIVDTPAIDKGEVSILVIMGEDVQYEKKIRDSFLDHLQKKLAARGYKIVSQIYDPGFEPGSYAAPDEANAIPRSSAGLKWSQLIKDIEFKNSHQKVDFFVTIGTYSTQAVIRSGILGQFNSQLIYLGVTDPEKVHFVGNPDTAGVQYGTGGKDYGQMMDALFRPEQRLVFLFNQGTKQDEIFSENLKELNEEFASYPPSKRRSPRFEFDIKAKGTDIELFHIQKPDTANPFQSPIYFAWYGLDNILGKNGNCAEIFEKKLWVVPSTYSTANLNAAGVIVSVVDEHVGELGADIVLKKIDDPQLDLAQVPVMKTPFRTWICRHTVNQNGMIRAIRADVLDSKNKNKYPWVIFDDAR